MKTAKIFLIAVTMASAAAMAQQHPVVILDVTRTGVAMPEVAKAAGTDVTPIDNRNRIAIISLGDADKLNDVQSARAAILDARAAGNSPRIITSQGEPIDVIVISDSDCDPPKLDPSEIERTSRIAADLKTLKDLAGKLAKEKLTAVPSTAKTTRFVYRIQKRRSDITFTASAKCGAETIKADATVNAGPVEHLSLSADMPLSKTSDIKALTGIGAAATDAAATTSAPRRFYIGANYTFGDVVTTPESWASLNNFSIKALVLASKKPADGYGAGVGYQLPAKTIFGFDLSTMGIFGAYFWERTDGNHHRGGHPRVGATFNLKKALDFVKSKS